MNEVNLERTFVAGAVGLLSNNMLRGLPTKYLGYQTLTGVLSWPFAIVIFSSLTSTFLIQKSGILKNEHFFVRELVSLSVTVITTVAFAVLFSGLTGAAASLGSVMVASSLLGAVLRISTLAFDNLYRLYASYNLNTLKTLVKDLNGKFKGKKYDIDQALHLPAPTLDKIIYSRQTKDSNAELRVNHLFLTMIFEEGEKKIKAEYYENKSRGNDPQAKLLWTDENIFRNKEFFEGMNEIITKDRCLQSGLPIALEKYIQLSQAIGNEIGLLKNLTIKSSIVNEVEDLKKYVDQLINKITHTIACWVVVTGVKDTYLESRLVKQSGYLKLIEDWNNFDKKLSEMN